MKKILSVMLSLLLVFSTISVVFTLPASAKTVTYTVFEEDFEDFNIGDAPEPITKLLGKIMTEQAVATLKVAYLPQTVGLQLAQQ